MKNNRKGFTITELVIVIAVIAILAAVLIPTFSSIIKKANDSSDLQAARSIYTEYTANFDYTTGGTPEQNIVVKVDDDSYLIVEDGKMQDDVYESANKAAKDGLGIAVGEGYELLTKSSAETGDTTDGTVANS